MILEVNDIGVQQRHRKSVDHIIRLYSIMISTESTLFYTDTIYGAIY